MPLTEVSPNARRHVGHSQSSRPLRKGLSPFDKYCILSRSRCCTEHAEDHNRDGRHRTVLSSTFSSSSIRVLHGGIAAEIRVPLTQRLSLPCLAIDRDQFGEVLGHIMERGSCLLRQPYRDKTPFVQASPPTATVLGARQRNDRPYPYRIKEVASPPVGPPSLVILRSLVIMPSHVSHVKAVVI